MIKDQRLSLSYNTYNAPIFLAFSRLSLVVILSLHDNNIIRLKHCISVAFKLLLHYITDHDVLRSLFSLFVRITKFV